MHVPSAHREIGHGTPQPDALVTAQLQLQDLPHMQAGLLHHQAADFATGHDQPQLAICGGQHLAH